MPKEQTKKADLVAALKRPCLLHENVCRDDDAKGAEMVNMMNNDSPADCFAATRARLRHYGMVTYMPSRIVPPTSEKSSSPERSSRGGYRSVAGKAGVLTRNWWKSPGYRLLQAAFGSGLLCTSGVDCTGSRMRKILAAPERLRNQSVTASTPPVLAAPPGVRVTHLPMPKASSFLFGYRA